MAKSNPAPSVAPNYPNAVIDFDAVHANDAAGKSGNALFDGAVIAPIDDTPPAAAPEPVAPAAKDAGTAQKPAA